MAKELEKYAAGLEELVHERTLELEAEQKKSEELLNREISRRYPFCRFDKISFTHFLMLYGLCESQQE
jgi:nitrate/nitrite-specific signal transduction histidine kinase